MEPQVIYQDSYLLVINKPAGWIVNEAQTTGKNPVLQSWLMQNFDYGIVGEREYRSGIVHRLDKDTSGVLLIAKTPETFHFLQAQFKKREVKKSYTALLHGKLEPKEGEVKTTVGRLPWNRERFGVLAGGREAETNYKVIDYYKKQNDIYSLTEFFPKTGRTHQLRIHAKYLNHPIVSDEFYAGRKTSRRDKTWCERLFLHAEKISFTHPDNGKPMNFDAEIPPDLKKALDSLEKLPQTP